MTKINRHGKRQQRVFGIDGYNIYNYKSKKLLGDPNLQQEKNVSSSFFSGFLTKKLFPVKRSTRAINTIEEVKKI